MSRVYRRTSNAPVFVLVQLRARRFHRFFFALDALFFVQNAVAPVELFLFFRL
jgi:hypothetical protein